MKTGITLFVYNRPQHTKQVLEGLKQNNIKKLYIFADGLKKEEHKTGWEEVRSLISEINWCETEIIKSDINNGLAKNIVYGVNYVLEKHERIIVLEDDCVPTCTYVEFMEQCFEKYESEDKVMSITGYALPLVMPSDYCYDIYFTNRISSWGWGTWRRAWKHFEIDYEILRRIKRSDKKMKILDIAGNDLSHMLKQQIEGKIDSWAVFWALKVIENEGVCISPVRSLIKNVGFDGTGTNCDDYSKYDIDYRKFNINHVRFPNTVKTNNYVDNSLRNLLMKEEKEDRYILYYHMLQNWINNLHLNKSINDYIKNTNFDSIAIYGSGEIAKIVYDEFNKDSLTKVKCFIDKYANDEKFDYIGNLPSVSFEKFFENYNSQLVIVTPIYDFSNICQQFKSIGFKGKVESLNNIIYSL